MRNMSEKKVTEGDVLFKVSRCSDDGKLHLWKTQVTEIIVTKTPTGRERKPIVMARPINYEWRSGKDASQHDFWGYDKLYAWCKADKSRERWVGLILSSEFVLLFGSVPIRYVEDDGCLCYMTADLAWKRFDAWDKKTGEATLSGEATL